MRKAEKERLFRQMLGDIPQFKKGPEEPQEDNLVKTSYSVRKSLQGRLKVLAASKGRTIGDLLEEGILMVLNKYNG